jgi:hypothetical protein
MSPWNRCRRVSWHDLDEPLVAAWPDAIWPSAGRTATAALYPPVASTDPSPVLTRLSIRADRRGIQVGDDFHVPRGEIRGGFVLPGRERRPG